MISPTKLIRNVRNPKFLSNWLEVWTAKIEDADNYTISPSSHWKFPIDQIVDDEGNNISWDNVFEDLPIMTQENAGIAKAGTGLSMNDSTVNVAINQDNIDNIISDEIISKSKLDPEIAIRGGSSSSSDDNAFIIELGTISIDDLDSTLQNKIQVAASDITIDRMDTNLLGVGVGAEDSPENNAILTDTEKAKCGIWIQY